MSLLKQSLNLTHHSLQSFISEACEGNLAYQFLQLSQHPKFSTISQKISNLWKIFTYQTYRTAKQKNLLAGLSQKQVKSLKSLSILNIFEDQKSVPIKTLTRDLQVDKMNLFKILLQMNSKELINIKIDQKNNQVLVLASKRRYQQTVPKQILINQCYSRLNKILQQNGKLSQVISKNS